MLHGLYVVHQGHLDDQGILSISSYIFQGGRPQADPGLQLVQQETMLKVHI